MNNELIREYLKISYDFFKPKTEGGNYGRYPDGMFGKLAKLTADEHSCFMNITKSFNVAFHKDVVLKRYHSGSKEYQELESSLEKEFCVYYEEVISKTENLEDLLN